MQISLDKSLSSRNVATTLFSPENSFSIPGMHISYFVMTVENALQTRAQDHKTIVKRGNSACEFQVVSLQRCSCDKCDINHMPLSNTGAWRSMYQ
jgi:bifunctional pyridoxal-dependent enzyme with beta-cystathionase and maltose regulon repressor activities